MTPEIEKKRRELFDAWFDKEVLSTISYGSPDILKRQMWRPFNAALDAVEIVFPSQRDEKYQDYYDDVEGGSFNYCRYLNDVRNAITATGLGLRIK
ncbi:hypothetical protein QM298_14260 [Pseudomonas mendocina]|nr:hypothetical protein [Pseudomonas mendocina]MDV5862043.1 hypothetical protein [Pseudomonas mendocina]